MPFEYLFPQQASDLNSPLPSDNPAQVAENLKKLGAAMTEKALAPGKTTGRRRAIRRSIPTGDNSLTMT